MKRENIAILGSTGSIGTQTLSVLEDVGDKNIYALATNENIDLLYKQIKKYNPKYASVYDYEKYKILQKKVQKAKLKTKILTGDSGLIQISKDKNIDFFVNAMSSRGCVEGIELNILITKNIINQKKKIAMANKETIVCAGKEIMSLARKNKVEIRPIDSEHSAIWQCIKDENKKRIKKILITCSGGPFYGKKEKDLKNVKVSDCMKHPNWKMGQKITIDSATLVNKGLEIIEAHFLFDLKPSQIDVVVQKESIIHSMVEFCDGSVMAQLGASDMRIPIAYAIYEKERPEISARRLDFKNIEKISIGTVDSKTFPAVELAYKAIKKGSKFMKKYCIADEVAVRKFIDGKIKFLDIVKYIKNEMGM